MEKVSIIIPTFKRCDTLERAIDSVIKQTYKNIEIIVVDDNNPDSPYRKDTENVMKKYSNISNIIYLKHPKNMNGSCARNTGISFSSGKYIGFLDDDDEFNIRKIEYQVNSLRQSDDTVGAVYCGFNIIRGNKIIKSTIPKVSGNLAEELFLMEWGTGSGSNVLFKASVLKEINGFDEKLLRHQDWDVLLRMFVKYNIIYTDTEQSLLNIYKDSRINIPNADRFVDIKQYFLDKHGKEINSFDIKIQNKIYQKHNLELCIAFLKNKNIKRALSFYKKCNRFERLKFKESLNVLLVLIFIYLPFQQKILVLFGRLIEKMRFIKD